MALGEQLRKARLAKKETTSQVAAATRIMVRQVEALEQEDFGKIPATIYGKGFIRLYAEHVGLDPQPLIAEYAARFGGPKVSSMGPEQIVATTSEEREAEAPAPLTARSAESKPPKPRPAEPRPAEPPAEEEKKPRARKSDRQFTEPDLFSRVGMPMAGVASAASKPQAWVPLAAPAPPAARPAQPANMEAEASPPVLSPAAKPPFALREPGARPKTPEGQSLKLQAEGTCPASMDRLREVSGIAAFAGFMRRLGQRMTRWGRALAGWADKMLEEFSFAQLLKSPAKMAVLAAAVLLIIVFIVSGLSRLFGPGAGRPAAPVQWTPKELQLTVDPPSPYFEASDGR
ncbi:MAG: helix-turn-helix transcriptional regulator [Verrucomicrobiota bacterium]|nr:helix-turn-helix transcriptional regulator [Verrucomicrobiota bacterium]